MYKPISIFGDELSAVSVGEVLKRQDIRPYSKICFLTSTLPTQFKELGRSYYRNLVAKHAGNIYTEEEIIPTDLILRDVFSNAYGHESFKLLPRWSWFIKCKFRLKTPYISRDDTPFYIIDNPVRKDKVFKIPMVSPSQWKGALQAVMIRNVVQNMDLATGKGREAHAADRAAITGIFGDESKAVLDYFRKLYAKDKSAGKSEMEDKFKMLIGRFEDLEPSRLSEALKKTDLESFSKSGRLRFYPAFFDKIGLEVINPHDRVRKVGINPIYIETAPSGSRAIFKMLYVPLDLIGRPEADISNAVARDLELIGKSLREMFTIIGFGAKISSGFGVAADKVEEGFWMGKGFPLIQQRQNDPSEPPRVPDELQEFMDKNPNVDFYKKVKELPGGKKKKAAFRKAKKLFQKFEKEKQAWQENQANQKKQPSDRKSFDSFDDLSNLMKKYAESLRGPSHGNK